MACLKSFPGLFRTLRRRAATLFPSALLLACLLPCVAASGQQYGPEFYSGMRWRLVGPFRAGRVTAVAGIAGRPAVYYMATPGGGVWKTTDGGEVWKPIFDDARVASIGALALAPSNPEVIYVGTGEQTEGQGVYRSNDSGKTWANVGLKETHYISSIIVDPRNPDVVYVMQTTMYRSTDGGRTFEAYKGGPAARTSTSSGLRPTTRGG